jgi:adenylate cyclase
MTLLFADVRGSTAAGEMMSPLQFSQLINRFYETATRVLVNADAWIDKLVGDEVIGFFFPYIGEHARPAVEAARELLRATGHGEAEGPWLPVGAGVHTGVAYVGVVGSKDTVSDVTALGDAVNVTARLASLARAGEILVSDAAYAAAGLDEEPHEHRQADLKGRAEPVGVHVLRVGALPAGPDAQRPHA